MPEMEPIRLDASSGINTSFWLGAVAILCRAAALPRMRKILDQYEKQSGHSGELIVGASKGAEEFPPLIVHP